MAEDQINTAARKLSHLLDNEHGRYRTANALQEPAYLYGSYDLRYVAKEFIDFLNQETACETKDRP
jgi:hypothetical protein